MIWKKLKIDLEEIGNYCRAKTFSQRLSEKRGKASFRRTAKQFSIKNGQLCYKESRRVIAAKNRQVDIVHDIHKGSGDTSHSRAMSAHLGRTPTYQKIAASFFRYGIQNNVANYIQKCDRCISKLEKVHAFQKKNTSDELNISVKSKISFHDKPLIYK